MSYLIGLVVALFVVIGVSHAIDIGWPLCPGDTHTIYGFLRVIRIPLGIPFRFHVEPSLGISLNIGTHPRKLHWMLKQLLPWHVYNIVMPFVDIVFDGVPF